MFVKSQTFLIMTLPVYCLSTIPSWQVTLYTSQEDKHDLTFPLTVLVSAQDYRLILLQSWVVRRRPFLTVTKVNTKYEILMHLSIKTLCPISDLLGNNFSVSITKTKHYSSPRIIYYNKTEHVYRLCYHISSVVRDVMCVKVYELKILHQKYKPFNKKLSL
jgi:hypothetical protein